MVLVLCPASGTLHDGVAGSSWPRLTVILDPGGGRAMATPPVRMRAKGGTQRLVENAIHAGHPEGQIPSEKQIRQHVPGAEAAHPEEIATEPRQCHRDERWSGKEGGQNTDGIEAANGPAVG